MLLRAHIINDLKKEDKTEKYFNVIQGKQNLSLYLKYKIQLSDI